MFYIELYWYSSKYVDEKRVFCQRKTPDNTTYLYHLFRVKTFLQVLDLG